MTKETFLQKLMPSYESYFDIQYDVQVGSRQYPATAEFHSRSEKYVLVRSAKIWATEMNEYAYFAFADVPTLDDYQSLKQDVLKSGLSQIKPHSEHMYSYVSLILVADLLPQEVIKEIQKTKYHKTFLFSLHGWMYLRIAAVDLSNGKVYSNQRGNELLPLLQNIFS
ncbi:hypothetical protein [Anaerotignum sp.]|uniref:hypothetical protein n=1 Tax=Anaerotignum sp. TaxID=2039241 RepID=UPI0028A60081|nr:hypothetical protein [Anaerotignum sp.]